MRIIITTVPQIKNDGHEKNEGTIRICGKFENFSCFAFNGKLHLQFVNTPYTSARRESIPICLTNSDIEIEMRLYEPDRLITPIFQLIHQPLSATPVFDEKTGDYKVREAIGKMTVRIVDFPRGHWVERSQETHLIYDADQIEFSSKDAPTKHLVFSAEVLATLQHH